MTGLGQAAEYAAEQLARLERAQAQLAELVGEGASPEGYALARTGAHGRVLELRIDEYATRLSSTTLGNEIIAAITAAQTDHARQVGELLGEQVGAPPSALDDGNFEQRLQRLDALTEKLESMTRRLGR